jgi:CBS domain-containing protein
MQVQQIMSRRLKVVESSATLLDAAKLMRDADVGALPVTEGGRPIGIVTDRDIVVRAVADEQDPARVYVREVVTPRISTIYADQDVSEAAKLMASDQVRRLLVIDRERTPVGVVSLGDLARTAETKEPGAEALSGVSDAEHPHSWQNAKHP